MIYREDGYASYQNRNGKPVWLSPKAMQRDRVHMCLTNLRKRCKKLELPLDVDIEYLLEIFPDDFICPASGIKMNWGNDTGKSDSPSLDRIKPELGYVKGNVIWVVNKVNITKSNWSLNDLNKIISFYNSLVIDKPS